MDTTLTSINLRQRDIIPQDKINTPILVIGAGAIGGWACLTLSKSGFTNISVFDDDTVEAHNIGIQPFGVSHLGMKKVDAIAQICKDQANVELQAYPVKYTGQKGFTGIIIVAVDSMTARKMIFNSVQQFKYYMDFRMGSQYALGYAFDTSLGYNWYSNTLYSDEDSVPERCTAKATTFCATMIGSLVTKMLLLRLTAAYTTQILQFDIDKLALKYTHQGGKQ